MTVADGEGGNVTLVTNITHSLLGIPKKGDQAYPFEFFEKYDAGTKEAIVIKSDTAFGYRDEKDEFYTTLASKTSGQSKSIEFAGTYNDLDEGDFIMNGAGETVSGYYQVFCEDNGCTPAPVTYALSTRNQLIEVDPTRDASTLIVRFGALSHV